MPELLSADSWCSGRAALATTLRSRETAVRASMSPTTQPGAVLNVETVLASSPTADLAGFLRIVARDEEADERLAPRVQCCQFISRVLQVVEGRAVLGLDLFEAVV